MFRIKVTVHILLKKRRAVNNNTLLDAQKRQKTPLIVVKSSLFIASRRLTRDFRKKQRKHLTEYIMAELLPTICIAGHNHCMDPA